MHALVLFTAALVSFASAQALFEEEDLQSSDTFSRDCEPEEVCVANVSTNASKFINTLLTLYEVSQRQGMRVRRYSRTVRRQRLLQR